MWSNDNTKQLNGFWKVAFIQTYNSIWNKSRKFIARLDHFAVVEVEIEF